MSMNKANWKVHFNKLLKHIAHDLNKGLTGQTYSWHNVTVKTSDSKQVEFSQGAITETFDVNHLGTEENDYIDNRVKNWLNIPIIPSKIIQTTNSLETNTMANTNTVVNNAVSTLKTVGDQIKDSAITSAKMEAGENILLALRNIVMNQAGFVQKVKFKFAPIALDLAVTVGADVLVAELMPDSKKAKLATECLNLALTKEVIHALPIKDFTNAMTGGEALGKVSDLLNITK